MHVQAERRGLSAFIACTCNHDRRFRVRAGPFSSKRRALKSKANGLAEKSASPAPLRFLGRCGESPADGVAGYSTAAPAQGKAFP